VALLGRLRQIDPHHHVTSEALSLGALYQRIWKFLGHRGVLTGVMPKARYLALPVIATALIAAGCGGSSYGGGGSSSSPSSSASSAAKVEAQSSSLGKILTDGSGRTLYLFQKDSGPKSTCSGACASNWPPFTAKTKPAVSGGASSADITLISRAGGGKQVTYKGHPLYYYAGDKSAGDMNGQGVNAFGAAWYVLSPAGSTVMGKASSGGGGSSSGGSTGRYGY
jgi:predicted lipoprotein with Yx(FWY)xxD motif